MSIQEAIIVKQNFQTSIESVWNAITDLEQMQQWYFPAISEFKAEVGFTTRFLIQNEGRNFTHIWKITEVIHQKQISYTWNFEEYPGQGLSTFTLTKKGKEVELTLQNVVIDYFPEEIPEFKRESGVAGWHYLIKQNLVKFLAI